MLVFLGYVVGAGGPAAPLTGLQQLIFKLGGESRPHGCATMMLNDLLHDYCRDMNLSTKLLPTADALVEDHPYKKQPDASYIPMNLPPGRSQKWPTLVF